MDKDNNENSLSKKLEVLLDLETEALFLHEKIDEFINAQLDPIDLPNDEWKIKLHASFGEFFIADSSRINMRIIWFQILKIHGKL